MPCLEPTDLTETADLHIKAQQAIVTNLRKRVPELEQERLRLIGEGDASGNSERLKMVNQAIAHLRLELNGEVETEPGSGKFERDPSKRSAEDRFAVMERLYRDRQHYQFVDTSKDLDDPRKASVFGLPTIKEMINRGEPEIAEEIMVRATSLLATKNDSRNPVDYLDTDGLEVKLALANQIEHHHIYNNVKLDENGRVNPKSFRISMDKNGELAMSVIPSYWNAAEHGRNSQFIALMDAMHAGDDPVTHLHYYRFNDEEAEPIKKKIRQTAADKAAEATKTAERLQEKLADLEARRSDPVSYERSLEAQKSALQAELDNIEQLNAPFKGKRSLTDEQRSQKEDLAAQKKAKLAESKAIDRKLDEHRSIQNLRSDIEASESAIADLQDQVKSIKLNQIPKGPERDAKKLERLAIEESIRDLRFKLKDQRKLLDTKGDIDEAITRTQKSLREAQLIADLDEDKAIALFEKQNGFFSFDKGMEEKSDHATYRPVMNEEITRFYVREAVEHLKEQHGDRWLDELQNITARQYRNNLLQRVGALVDKLDPNRRSKKKFFEGEWGKDESDQVVSSPDT